MRVICCLVLAGLVFTGNCPGASIPAFAQVLEVCTVKPAFFCEDEHKCTSEQLALAKKWIFSCNTAQQPDRKKKGSNTQPTDPHLSEPFDLPALSPVKWCGTTLKPAVQSVPLDFPTMLTRISSTGYTFTPSGNYVLAVSQTPAANGGKQPALVPGLNDLNETIRLLLETIPANPGTFSVELVMPHAAAFGSTLATQVSALNSPFTLKATGRDRMAVSTSNGVPPSCDDWNAFLVDLRELAWSVHPETFEARLTATDASAMATALGVGAVAAPATGGTTPAASPAATPVAGAPAATAATPASPALTITVTPPPAAGATPAAGAPSTATTITVAPASTPAPAPAATTPPAAPAGVAGAATPGVSIGSVEPDLLLFSDTNPGDDGLITEKKRAAAILDLPRPEMTITAWVMQNSSTDPESVNQSSQKVREEVRHYNEGLELTVFRGWKYLQKAMADDKYFDLPFYNYIARRVIFDGKRSLPPEVNAASVQQRAHDLLNEQDAPSDDIKIKPTNAYLGACGQDQYCLGYTTLFHPIKPRLTDLMLALIAAQKPLLQLTCAVNHAEGSASPAFGDIDPVRDCPVELPYQTVGCEDDDRHLIPCQIWRELEKSKEKDKPDMPNVEPRFYNGGTCEEKDYLGVLQSMLIAEKKPSADAPVMFLNCFRQAALLTFGATAEQGDTVTPLGLLRASIADFLFNYKMSQQYPHEFVAYDLTTSAQAMNSALRPLVDAFVRDVTAYQAVLKRRLGLQIEYIDKHITAGSMFDKARFFNNALVTVNTIANSEAMTDTSAESYLEAANAPTLGGLAGAISGATGAAGTATTAPTGALNQVEGATRFNEAQLIAAGLSQFQSSRVHIGRELMVDIKPESLLGANSAELQVVLKADDEATSGLYSSGATTGTDAEISRFGKNETTTRVRVDSLKLFEVSSFASQLMAPKRRFPLLPVPGLEMPYFGSILSVPLRPAREFHMSMSVISAVVIPTAADLAFSARFVADRLLAPENAAWNAAGDMDKPCYWPTDLEHLSPHDRPACRTRTMVSLRDFNGQPIREFNRMMTHCLETGGRSATPNLLPAEYPDSGVCNMLSYHDVIGDVQ
jgi:hypothetical protein